MRVEGIIEVIPELSACKVTIKTIACKDTIREGNPDAAIKRIKEIAKKLTRRRFDPAVFMDALYRAYKVHNDDTQEALLTEVQKDLWLNMQPTGFWQSFELSKACSYTTDEFSVDLSKLLSSGVVTTGQGRRLNLSTHGGGIPVYGQSGRYELYKFISFT